MINTQQGSEENMPDFGLVLSSDGSKSSFEIGAWKALRELNIEINAVTASFVGALNAALIAQGDFENAVRFWKNVYSKNLFGINRYIAQHYAEDWSKSDTKYFKKSFLKYIQGRSEELDPLKTNINIFIDEKKIRNSDMEFGFVSVSLNTLEAEMLTIDKIPKGKLTQYLLVAACFPQITQINRAADPQFSTLYSPYTMLKDMGCAKILTTDEAMVIPKGLTAQIDMIMAHELIELNMVESAEEMRKNIKMGYLDTLNIFKPTIGSYFMIENIESEAYVLFKNKFGEKFNNKIDELVKFMLHIDEVSKPIVEQRISQMLEAVGLGGKDYYLTLLENLGKLIGIHRNEKYTQEKLMKSILNETNKLIKINKAVITTSSSLKNTILSASLPENKTPDPNLFMQYFMILVSSSPAHHQKLSVFWGGLDLKVYIALVTLMYLSF